MTRLITALGMVFLCLMLTSCSGTAGGSCSSADDVGAKVTKLADDLKMAQSNGKLNPAQAGEIGAQILNAGTKYGAEKDHRSYCEALENIRKSAGL